MYVSLDRDKLRFLHVHPSQDVVWGLLYLEAGDVNHAGVWSTEAANFLQALTTLELNLLYRNTTSKDFDIRTNDETRREALAAIVNSMEPRNVNLSELDTQLEYVSRELEISRAVFRYVPGSKVPTQRQELFPLHGFPPTEAEFTVFAQLAPQRQARVPAAVPQATRETAPRSPAAGPRAATGSVRPTIWQHADKVWEEAGKPTDKAVVLELRKRMMVELEQQGIKKTSSSNELGNWMKDRIM